MMYRARIVMTVVAASVALSALPALAQSTAYQNFPLDGINTGANSNNVWVFVEDNAGYLVEPTQARVVRVTDSAWYRKGWFGHDLAGLLGEDAVSIYDNSYYSGMWAHDGNDFSLMLDYSAQIGDAWSFRSSACQAYNVEMLAKDVTVFAPAGEFGGVWSFDFIRTPDANVRCTSDALGHLLTAPSIGPVGYVSQTHKGHLLYARVADNVVAAGPGETRIDPSNPNMEYTLALTTSVISSTPIQCITFPCNPLAGTLQFALTVTNNGNTSETLNFSSGQKFEVDLFDTTGHTASWSDGQVFTQATSSLVLEPGETEVFYATMPFANRDGEAFYGDVQVVAYMKSSSPKLSTNVTGE